MNLPDIVLKPNIPAPYSYTAMGLNVPIDAPDARNFDLQHGLIERHKYKYAGTVDDFLVKHSISFNGQPLNSKIIRNEFSADIQSLFEDKEQLQLITVVCPPYICRQLHSRENIGLFSDFKSDGIDYNFMFDYKIIAFDMCFVAMEIERLTGVQTKSYYIVSDWALRDISGIRETIPNESDIASVFGRFKKSGEAFISDILPGLNAKILGYRDLGLDRKLPFSMPISTLDRELYIAELKENGFPNLSDFDGSIFNTLIEVYNTDRGQKLFKASEDTAAWPSVETLFPELFSRIDETNLKYVKKFVVDFLRLMRNTKTDRYDETSDEEIIKSSFFDAMVKAYEYMIIGRALDNNFRRGWNMSWDTKFSASGHFYSKGGIKTFYINPRSIPTPMSHLGSKFNPY